MADPGFVPFIPRRASAPAPSVEGEYGAAETPAIDGAVEYRAIDGAVEFIRPQAQQSEPEQHELESEKRMPLPEPAAELPELRQKEPQHVEQPVCDHRRQIRDEAVRLAAIACGRALRRAIALHPKVLASFVDDAIAAAGHPENARIRLQPDAIAVLAGRSYECVADAELDYGEVVVESGGASIGASLDERARLLTRAAAET